MSRDKNWDVIIERETAWGAGAIAASILGIEYYLELVGPVVASICIRKARKILANTKGVVTEDLPPDKVLVLSAGVNTNIYQSCGGKNEKDTNLIVGYFGGFLDFHGIGSIVSAIQPVKECLPDTRFLFVGPYFADVKSKIEKLELDMWSIFTGPVSYEEVPGLISKCDIVLAPYDPSKSPLTRNRGLFGSPLKVFEYMACGKPIIATRVGTIPDVFRHARCGILIQPGSSEELAGAIIRLLRNPVARLRMGKRGLAAIDDFSWNSIAMKILRSIEKDRARSRVIQNEGGR